MTLHSMPDCKFHHCPASLLQACSTVECCIEQMLLDCGRCRFLSRLLLLHGRWSYMRNKEVVLYSFYKNWAYVLVYVYLQFVAGEYAR